MDIGEAGGGVLVSSFIEENGFGCQLFLDILPAGLPFALELFECLALAAGFGEPAAAYAVKGLRNKLLLF